MTIPSRTDCRRPLSPIPNGRDFPEATSCIAPPNRADAVAFSLSSIGGEGWGEEALSGRGDRGSWKAAISFLTRIGTMNLVELPLRVAAQRDRIRI